MVFKDFRCCSEQSSTLNNHLPKEIADANAKLQLYLMAYVKTIGCVFI